MGFGLCTCNAGLPTPLVEIIPVLTLWFHVQTTVAAMLIEAPSWYRLAEGSRWRGGRRHHHVVVLLVSGPAGGVHVRIPRVLREIKSASPLAGARELHHETDKARPNPIALDNVSDREHSPRTSIMGQKACGPVLFVVVDTVGRKGPCPARASLNIDGGSLAARCLPGGLCTHRCRATRQPWPCCCSRRSAGSESCHCCRRRPPAPAAEPVKCIERRWQDSERQ